MAHRPQVTGATLGERVAETSVALKDEGIVDHWRKDDDGFHLMNTTCPYRKAAEASDAPCHADHKVVESLIGVPVEQVSRMVDGHHMCEYVVRESQRAASSRRSIAAATGASASDQRTPAPARRRGRMADELLKISGLKVAVDGKQILNGVDLTVNRGEVHAIMGPNGSGKSTLANALMGHPRYEVTGGTVLLQGRGHPRPVAGRARATRHVPGVPVPDEHPRRDDGQLPARRR